MVVPKLRFRDENGKEFPEWRKIRLGDYLTSFNNRVSANTNVPVYTSSRKGLKPQFDYFDNRELVNDGEYGIVPNGYATYRHMSDDSIFKFNENTTGHDIAVSKEYPVFTTSGMNLKFVLTMLNESNGFKKFAIEKKAGGTRVRLYFKTLCEWKNAFFPHILEQTKIANFLSAVDERIQQTNQTHSLLTQYKKGIMQKIFSQQLRFKDENGAEFGEWKSRSIKEILTIGSGRDYKHLNNGNVPVYGTGGLMTTVDGFLYDGETVCIGRKGTIDKPFFHSGKIWTVDTLFYTHKFIDVFPQFVYQLFLTINWREHNEASGVPSLSKNTIEGIAVNIPTLPEQTKIANFLSAIDDKINQIKSQLTALQQYKRGLLQQMFV